MRVFVRFARFLDGCAHCIERATNVRYVHGNGYSCIKDAFASICPQPEFPAPPLSHVALASIFPFSLRCVAFHGQLCDSGVPCAAAIGFSSSTWIRTNEVSDGVTPVGACAFRKNFTPPLGKVPVHADVLITVDDTFILYANGVKVGADGDWRFAERFCISL
ncbi:hypothetical protein C8R44DRAFT_789240 [Mycena epipterygia]|nr:hypothetical protein C8R44DRAFT_789240 [Mycena epipterygia]